MKLIKITALAGIIAAGCASPAPTEQSEEPLAGGFAPADETADWTKEAQSLAIDAIYEKYPTRALVGRVTSEVQVVAGLNYRFIVEMSGSENYRSTTAFKNAFEVVVYRDLEGNMEVTELKQIRGR